MTMIIKPQEFAYRRQQLLTTIGKGAIAIVASAPKYIRNGDSHYAFRQDSDFYYLTGFPEPEAIAVFAPGRAEGEYILFNRPNNPSREVWDGKRAGQSGACKEFGAQQAFSIEEFPQHLPQLIQNRQKLYYVVGRYAEFERLLFDVIPKIEVVDLKHWLHEQRLIKSEAEIATMRKAAAISAQAHQRAMTRCKPGLYEYHIEAELLYEFCRQGAREVAYGSIVAGGENSCILHYHENNCLLKNGDLLLIDAGCEYQNYAADITRTFPINGKFSSEQKAIYELVLAAQLTVIENIKPGLMWNKVNEITIRVLTEGLVKLGLLKGEVDQLINERAFSKFFMHGTTHWLGLDVHDAGSYKVDGDWRALKPGMVLTVEPGIYIAANSPDVDPKWWNIGVRIEDDVLVTADGCEVLSASLPKTLAEIESLVGQAQNLLL